MDIEETGAKIAREESADICINVAPVVPLLSFMTMESFGCREVLLLNPILKSVNDQQ